MSDISYAKFFGLFGSGYLTGASLFLSAFAVPSMHLTTTPPAILQRQWQALYDSGKTWFPPTVVLTTVAFARVAWLARQDGGANYGAWEPWAVSATATVAIIPFTLLFMMPDIRRLEEARGKDKNLPGLIAKWSWLNMVRTGLHAVAFGTSLWTVCA